MRLLTTIFALIGGLFSILAYSRARLPYNEEGRYYDATAGVVYDTDAVTAYGFLGGVFFLFAAAVAALHYLIKHRDR